MRIAFFIFLSISFLGFSQKWKPEYDTCRAKFNRGDIEAATIWLENFLPTYKKQIDKDTLLYFEMVHLLGRCFMKQGFEADAETQFKEEIDFFVTNPKDVQKSTYASSLLYMGYLYFNKREYLKAEPYFREVLQLRATNGTLRKSQEIAILHNLATIANSDRNYPRADSIYNQVLLLKKKYYGEKSIETAKTHQTIGVLYTKMGLYPQAEESLWVNCMACRPAMRNSSK
ncbi:MAG: tetratricopeptide repeat protein [Cytophagaceae bacterium]|nr:tetratricopeptide repeat protein [Cytophagaceae bacterium]